MNEIDPYEEFLLELREDLTALRRTTTLFTEVGLDTRAIRNLIASTEDSIKRTQSIRDHRLQLIQNIQTRYTKRSNHGI